MCNKLIKKLVAIAESKGYIVQFEVYGLDNCAELYRRSQLLTDIKKIIVYHNTEFLKLVVLCHEVGHLQTIDNEIKYSIRAAFYEYTASKWAYQFLKHAGFNRLVEAKALLNNSLKNYEAKLI